MSFLRSIITNVYGHHLQQTIKANLAKFEKFYEIFSASTQHGTKNIYEEKIIIYTSCIEN